MLVKAAIDIGAWWLAASLLVAGFIITLTFGRVYLLAFWRPQVKQVGTQTAVTIQPGSSIAVTAIAGLALLVTIGGVFPETVFKLSELAAEGLVDPSAYIRSVFPEGSLR
jgi:multicomponent Na+:H+ antiporter subunit D